MSSKPIGADSRGKREAVMPISCYLLRHWARHLGPEAVCLIVAARQLAYEQSRRTPRGHARARIRAGGRTLARRAGISHSTVRRLLSDHGERGMALASFLQAAAGAGCNLVRRDDPLAPQHGRGLVAYLRQRCGQREAGAMADEDTSARALLEALDALMALPAAEALAALEDEPLAGPAANGGQPESVVSAALGLMPPEGPLRALAKQWCHQLQRHLVSPRRVVLTRRAFWRDWLPRLKPPQMVLLLNLRSRCFHDKRTGELRETCRLPVAKLALEMGVSRRQLRRQAAVLAAHGLARTISRGNGQHHTQWCVSMIDPDPPCDAPPATSGNASGDVGTTHRGHPEHGEAVRAGHPGHTIEDSFEKDSLGPRQGRAPKRPAASGIPPP